MNRGGQHRYDAGGGEQHEQTHVRMRCRYHHCAPQGRQVSATACYAALRTGAGPLRGGEPGERDGEPPILEGRRGAEPRRHGVKGLPNAAAPGAACGLRLAACGLRLCGLRLAACGLAACGLRLAACGLRLAACGLRLAACGLRLAACGLRLAACGLRLAACDCSQRTPRRCQGFSGLRRPVWNRQVRGLASVSSSVASCPCPLSLGPTRLVRQAVATAGNRAFCRPAADLHDCPLNQF